jgi:glycine cleavage system transcriptional repressor
MVERATSLHAPEGSLTLVPHVAVTALGADRPGIVAAVTGVLVRHGGNLEDTAMTNLGGHFAMMLVVEVPDSESAEALEQSLVTEVGGLGLTIAVRPIVEAPADAPTGEPWAVSLYGADRPGIVHRVAQKLADHGANIVDLSTRVIGPGPDHAYVLLLELNLPVTSDGDRLGIELSALADELGVEIHLRPDDADVL